MHSHDQHTHRLLSEIEAGTHVSQRSLARSLGIALGLTNHLIHRVVRKGWVRMIHIKPNRVSYLLTPTGLAEKARMSREYLQHSIRFYAAARDRIRESFALLSQQCVLSDAAAGSEPRVVFYSTGEVAEIGYICLQETNLKLVGAVHETTNAKPFLNVRMYGVAELSGAFDHAEIDYLVVMSFRDLETIRGTLVEHGVPLGRVFWL